MFLNPKILSVLLAVFVGMCVSTVVVLIHPDDHIWWIAGLSAAGFTGISAYLALHYLISREVDLMYEALGRLKRKDYKLQARRITSQLSPMKEVSDEIFTFVTTKQKELDELKKLEQYRREFLADLSHELKTPIFAAQGFVHTLLDGAASDKSVREKFLNKAAKSLDSLNELVTDLLDLSKLETGEMKMDPYEFNLVELVEDVFEQLENKAKKRECEIKLLLPENEVRVDVYADKLRIKQVISNLVENAIKYGKEKNGEVIVSIIRDKDHVIVSVKDDGPGIAPEHLHRIFERFYRIEKSRSKEMGGTGLGLAIVERIVDAHRSKVTVTSKLGKGTTFAFRLKKAGKKADNEKQLQGLDHQRK